jgi:hypothetical protein
VFPASLVGSPVNTVDRDGQLFTILDFAVESARGALAKQTVLRKFGRNPSVGASTVTISLTAGTTPYMPTAATKVTVTSADANDTAAGSGARSIIIFGLDATFNEISETIATNGATTGDSVNSYLRIYRAYVVDCGTYGGSNAGIMTVQATGVGGTVFVTIAAGLGQTQGTHFCTSYNKSFYLIDVHITVSALKSCDLQLVQRQEADDVTAPYRAVRVVNTYDGVAGGIDFTLETAQVFPPKTDIWFTGNAGAGGASVSIEYAGILYG